MDARTTAVRPAVRGRPREVLSPVVVGVHLLLVVLQAGCRVDPNIQLMEQELRLQDQRIFELEEHLSDCHEIVATHRRDSAALRRRLDESQGKELGAAAPLDGERRERPETVDGIPVPQVDEGDDDPGTQQRPPIESTPPLEDDAAGRMQQNEPTPAAGRPPDPADEPEGGDDSTPMPTGSRTGSPDLELLPAPNFTGAADDIEQIGLRLAVRYHTEESLPVQVEALVEPQDAKLRQVAAAGDVSLMIVAADEQTQQQLGRWELARWEFSKNDAELLWSKSQLGTGLQFELPWPGSPQPGEYRLWVRLVGDDGRKHLGSVDFDVSATQLARRAPPRELLQDAPPQEGPLLVQSPSQVEPTAQEQPTAPPAAAAPPEVAWRKSTEAALLPRRHAPPTSTTAESTRRKGPVDANPPDSWSPERPSASFESDAIASSHEPEWSAYR